MEQLDRDDIQFLMGVLLELELKHADPSVPAPIQQIINAIRPSLSGSDTAELDGLIEQKIKDLRYKGTQAFRIRVKLDEMLKDLEIAELTKQK